MASYRDSNKALWNEWARQHVDAELYDLAAFKQGETSLRHIELAELGDVNGQNLLHLQCHFGMDTLSLARLGARVTGVDFAEQAIEQARDLAVELALPARFLCHDLFDLPNHLDERFDVVFTSYGAICWLNDLGKWAEMIAAYLNPGGRFYMVEFHPLLLCLDDDASFGYPYFAGREPWRDLEASYANPEGPKRAHYTWAHHLGEVVSALLSAGLQLSFLHEFPYSVYGAFPFLQRESEQHYVLKDPDRARMPPRGLPLTFSLMARP